MENKKYSRKLSFLAAIFILLAGVFIGGYLVLKSGRGSASTLSDILNGSFNSATCSPDVNDASKDSDDDGLKDWQEIQTYQTDACKPDTDGDGYLDGEEIASGYDPTKAAPGDELPGTAPKGPRPLPSNLTEALKTKLLEQITQNKISAFDANGSLLSADELGQYPGIEEAVWEITKNQDQLFAPEPLDDNQLKIISDNSPAAFRRYGTDALSCFPANSKKPTITEAEMFLNAVNSGDFSELNRNLEEYKSIYEKTKNIQVPSKLLPIHRGVLNSFSSLIKIYESIKNIETDPLRANLALQKYEPLQGQFFNLMVEMENIMYSK